MEHKKLLKRIAELEELVMVDDMTGLYNYRYFKEAFTNEIARAKRYDRPLSLIVVDVNGLKKVNDELGHNFGNIAIVNVSIVLRENTRKTNSVCRYGGDEFVVILPETTNKQAKALADRLKKKVKTFQDEVTISVGVASYPENAKTVKGLFNYADRRMYKDKNDTK
jgi:diguanylate cyclase (GGDEF)-like protein